MDSQAEPPRPVRKLSYHAQSGDALSVTTMSTGDTATTTSCSQSSPLHSEFSVSPRLPPSDANTPASSRPVSISPSSSIPRTPNNSTKKRSSYFTGIFSAKEPSARALIEYQKQLLKQGNGRVSAVGLPGVSSAKLPPTVPKTNSKWDGIPHAVKERERQQEMVNRQSVGGIGRTTSTAGSSTSDVGSISASSWRKRDSRGTLGRSSAYTSSSNRMVDLYGWEKPGSSDSNLVKEKDFAIERPSTTQTTSSLSAPTLQPNSRFPPHEANSPQGLLGADIEQSPPPVMSGALGLPEHSHSPGHTPCEPSPVTPNGPSPLVSQIAPDSEKTLYEPSETIIAESADQVVLKSTGANILGPPAAGRRPKANQSHGQSEQIQELGAQLNSILKKEATPIKRTPPRPALASYFEGHNSGTSAAPLRRNSTRDRLGLGMTLKTQTHTPPWTAGTGAKGGRDITPTPEAGHSLRRKARMSMFKK